MASHCTNLVGRLLLSVMVMVLGGGVPAWQHSHAAGDRPHDHSAADDHDGLAASHTHQHVTLFGFDFTLPVDPDDHDSDEGQPTYLVAAPSAIELDQSDSHFVAWALPIFNSGEPVQIVPTFRCVTAIAAPLSDNARHERSGVLLI
jgi:hypothetical protein